MKAIKNIAQIGLDLFYLIIFKFLEGIDLEWIIKSRPNRYIGNGHSREKLEMDSFELTSY